MSNPVGRPRKIQSPEQLDALVDSYVLLCQTPGAETAITLTGLILSLGLSSRESFDEYLKYEGFSDSVKRAKLIIEHEYEKRLNGGANAAAPIFALKNFGWSDKQQLTLSGDEDSPIHVKHGMDKDAVELLSKIRGT